MQRLREVLVGMDVLEELLTSWEKCSGESGIRELSGGPLAAQRLTNKPLDH